MNAPGKESWMGMVEEKVQDYLIVRKYRRDLNKMFNDGVRPWTAARIIIDKWLHS